jgi:ankyrin repeat protein
MRTSIFCLLFVPGTLAVPASPADAPASSGATVNADSVPVYAETTSSSTVLKRLAKGETFNIDYSVTTAEGEWCGLGQPARGYVLCSYLKRDEPPKQDSAPLPTVLTPSINHPPEHSAGTHTPQLPAEPAIFTPEQSALMSAAKVGSAAAIQLALNKGALVNGRDKDGKTALMWAAYMGRNEAITELLSAGAEVNQADSFGWTPIEAAVWARHPAALELLLAQGPDVNPRDSEGRTPLMHAAQCGDLVMIRDLLAKGADPNASNRFGQTPLMFAVALPDPDAAALLIAAGADVNARDAAGRSVLINTVLTAADRTANVRLLMQARADLNAKDNDNRTALAWAIRKGQTAIAQLLKKSGAAEW